MKKSFELFDPALCLRCGIRTRKPPVKGILCLECHVEVAEEEAAKSGEPEPPQEENRFLREPQETTQGDLLVDNRPVDNRPPENRPRQDVPFLCPQPANPSAMPSGWRRRSQ
mgnify:CR=1 FL=1